MLKAPTQLSNAYRFLGSIYKTEASHTNFQFSNSKVTKKNLIGRAGQIRNEIQQRFHAIDTTACADDLAGVTYIPTVVLRVKTDDVILYKKTSVKLYFDNRASSALIYRNQQPVFIDNVLDSSYDLDAEAAYFFKRTPGQVVSLIRAAKKISQQVFFLEFAGLQKYQRSILGYFDNGQIRFIGFRFDKMQLFDNVDKLIEKIFGSKTKYQEVVSGKDPQKANEDSGPDKGTAHDRFDFLARLIGVLNPAPLTLAGLISYVARQVALTQCQKQILRYNLKAQLGINCDGVITDINYVVYHGLIIEYIGKTLTYAQVEMLFKGFYKPAGPTGRKQHNNLQNTGTEYFGQIVKFGRL